MPKHKASRSAMLKNLQKAWKSPSIGLSKVDSDSSLLFSVDSSSDSDDSISSRENSEFISEQSCLRTDSRKHRKISFFNNSTSLQLDPTQSTLITYSPTIVDNNAQLNAGSFVPSSSELFLSEADFERDNSDTNSPSSRILLCTSSVTNSDPICEASQVAPIFVSNDSIEPLDQEKEITHLSKKQLMRRLGITTTIHEMRDWRNVTNLTYPMIELHITLCRG